MHQVEGNKLPQSNMVDVDVWEEVGVSKVIAECEIACDCSGCAVQDLKVLAITRSKVELKSLLDWEEQKDVREEVSERNFE